jgi:hypothetical protein
MKNFAHVNEDNLVTMVIVGDSLDQVTKDFPGNLWVETYPGVEGKVHPGVGYKYLPEEDNFEPVFESFPSLEEIAAWDYPPPFEHLRPAE